MVFTILMGQGSINKNSNGTKHAPNGKLNMRTLPIDLQNGMPQIHAVVITIYYSG